MKFKKPTQDQLDKVRLSAEKAATEWASERQKNVRQEVHRLLDKNQEQIVLKLLGFDNHWGGRWELDHCNGRAGESAAGDWLREKAGAAVKEWLEKQTGRMPSIPPQTVKNLKERYREYFLREVEERLRTRARRDAEAFVNGDTAV